MVEPSWLAGTLAVVMVVVVVYSAARLVAGYAWRLRIERDVEIAHGAMGLSMAGMLERNLTLIPDSAWVAIFTASAIWFAARSVGIRAPLGAVGGPGHCVSLVVASGAMVYMLWAMPTWSGMATLICGPPMVGMTSSGFSSVKLPALGLGLAIFLFGNAAILALRRYRRGRPTGPTHTGTDEVARIETQRRSGGPPGAALGVGVLDPVLVENRGFDEALASPRIAVGCQVVMNVTMGYMLISMIHLV